MSGPEAMPYDLSGCYDLHIHPAPDVIARKLTDLQLAGRANAAGMAGFAVKSHVFPTGGRAAILRALYPKLDVLGGIALNRQVGGINPAAVEAAAKMGVKLLWFPTMDARSYLKQRGVSGWESGLSALDGKGAVTEEALAVLRLAVKYDLVVGTGHLGAEEAVILARTAAGMGLKRICITHVTLPVCQMPVERLRECVDLGAVLEYSYCHLLSGKCSIDYIVSQIKAVGAEHVILTTDLGQADNPDPIDGMRAFCRLLEEQGFSHQELERMTKENPKKLLYA